MLHDGSLSEWIQAGVMGVISNLFCIERLNMVENLICEVCPHRCELKPDEFGRCNLYQHTGASIENIFSGRCSMLAVEPIEKRPFFHYYPGSKFLSVGFFGCNFTCLHCQNFRVSQTTKGPSQTYTPDELAQLAEDRAVDGIAFTYNEPLLYYDYIQQVNDATIGIHTVVKTNGFIDLEVLESVAYYIDAFNVDIKGDDAEYQRVMGGRLHPVKRSIQWLADSDRHLEVSYLVLPRQIEDFEYHASMREWLSECSESIPVHLLYYYPFHRMTDPAYNIEQLMEVRDFFLQQMKYVYISNWYRSGSEDFRNTTCSECKSVLIDRQRGGKINNLICCQGQVEGEFV